MAGPARQGLTGAMFDPAPRREGPKTSREMFPEKAGGAIPRQLCRLAVVHRHALFVNEGMVGVVAEQFERLAGLFHRLLEAVDQLRGAPVVLAGEMRLQRNLHVRRLGGSLWRNAVKYDASRQLRNFGGADDRHRAAEAETGQAHFGAVAREKL